MLELQIDGGVFPGSSCLHDTDRSAYEEMHRSGADGGDTQLLGGVSTTTSLLFEDGRGFTLEPLHLHGPDLW